MRFSKMGFVLVFGLLLGGMFSPGAKASADETPAESSHLAVAASAELPDDPGAGMQQQDQIASSAPPPPGGSIAAQDPLAQGRQTKRILYVVPNFRSVSADQHLPPQSVKEKFKTAMLDSVDYSSFIFVGGQAGVAQASGSYREFGQGAKGYGRYYWHILADTINENTWVEFIVPSALHQDTRYYTLGKGPFGKRLGYAFTRIVITRTDSGRQTFNASEIVGAGAAAGVSNLYYPSSERTLTKTYQRWVTSLLIDGGVFVFREVWPDINNATFRQKD